MGFRAVLFLLCVGLAHGQTLSTHLNAVVEHKLRVATTNPADAADPTKATITIQYADGLGRPTQTIGYGQNPSGKDLVLQSQTYDAYSRPSNSLLPTPTNSSSGSHQPNATALAQSFYDDAPISTTSYEASPLNRPKATQGTGSAWQTANKKTEVFYEAAGTDIRKYVVDAAGNIILDGNYPDASLYKSRTIDEHGHTTIKITDKLGRTVATQQQDATGYMHTHYVYNALGQLAAIVQPEGYALNASIDKNSANYSNYVFAYGYDHRGRQNTAHVPGGGETYSIYDPWDRLVLSQTALERQTKDGQPLPLWTFIKYDALNREILRGNMPNQAGIEVQSYINNFNTRGYETRTSSPPLYYTNTAFPDWVNEGNINEVTYYDSYDHWLPAGMGWDAAGAYNAASHWPNAKGLQTGSRSKKTENGAWLATAQHYDTDGRVLQSYAQNPQGHIERTDYKYNFAGQLLELKETKKDAAGTATTSIRTYSYDYAGRKTAYHLQLGNINATIAQYEYDAIGRLARKKLMPNATYHTGGAQDYINRSTNPTASDQARKAICILPNTLVLPSTSSYTATIDPNAAVGSPIVGLQAIDYAYHIRGGLLGINLDNAKNPIPNSTEGDLFAYKLDYETAGQWDGNIGKQSWASFKENTLENRSYAHSYDPAKRLKSSIYGGVGAENFSLPNINYDKNGNITYLQRNGKVGSGSNFGQIDNLSYSYSGNRLNTVTDAISGNNGVDFVQRGSANYTYWNDGSLKSDANDQISNILYDSYLKQPKEIQLTDGRWLKHYYNGAGTLLKTVYSNGEYWDFVGNMIYKNGLPYQMNFPEGRAIYVNGNWQYEFAYKDHLGNTRLSFKANGNNLEKTAETAFDPWGVRLNGVGVVNGVQNRFELQNHEKESTFGLNRINFGARTLNPTTGVFDRTDRYSSKYSNLSPFQFSANNPINIVDINGDSLWINNQGKNILYNNGSLFREDGSEFKGKLNGFIKQSIGALNTINNTELGKGLLKELSESSNNFYIKHANNNKNVGENEFSDFNRNASYSKAMKEANQGFPIEGGSGGDVFWNPYEGQVIEQGGRPAFRPISNLGHELFHASDANNGLTDNRASNIGLKRSEVRASFFENNLRNSLGYPYREFYNTIQFGPVRLLDVKDKPINFEIKK